VEEIMTQDLVTADPTDTVVDCMRVMTEERVRHLPVIKGPKMLGILSIGDLIKYLISAQAETIDNLEQYLTGAILD
jgi:CBS domain-containing protein